MYAYLYGKVMGVTADNCIIDVNNIGYNVRISSSTAQNLPPIGEEVRLYTYTSVREDAIQLMGFLSYDDLQMFKQLITVSGIGPKGGMAILGILDADAVRFAIATGDVKSIAQAPGVGKRSAERIIIDLKGKIDAESLLTPSDNGMGQNTVRNNNELDGKLKEASEALTALGYGASEAMKAVRGIELTDDMDVEDILKLALKELI